MPATTIREQAEAIVDAQLAARARHVGGVSYGGMTQELAEVETVEAVAARLQADEARAAAFRLTPRGRFLTAIEGLRELGYYDEEYRLYGLYSRSLADVREPLDVGAVGAAVAILNALNVADAREAMDALAELLIEAGAFKMAAE